MLFGKRIALYILLYEYMIEIYYHHSPLTFDGVEVLIDFCAIFFPSISVIHHLLTLLNAWELYYMYIYTCIYICIAKTLCVVNLSKSSCVHYRTVINSMCACSNQGPQPFTTRTSVDRIHHIELSR